MIKLITPSELPRIADMGNLFYAEGLIPGRFSSEVFIRRWSALIEQDIGFILGLLIDGKFIGAFGAIISPDVNDDDLVANECFWFVHPEHRGRGLQLLIEYENEARRRGAKRCSMIHLLSLQPERLSELYKRRGYRPIETSYFKDLN